MLEADGGGHSGGHGTGKMAQDLVAARGDIDALRVSAMAQGGRGWRSEPTVGVARRAVLACT